MDNNFSVIFDNNDLSTIDGLIIHDHNFNDLPNKDININTLARDDKSIITSVKYTDKSATVSGIVLKCDRYESEAILKTLRSYLTQYNKKLSIEQYGTTVEYTATLKGMTHEWFTNKLRFELQFVCSDPIGVDTTYTALPATNVIVATESIPFIVDGSYKIQPQITLDFVSVTDGTAATVTLTNTTTNQSFIVTRDWVTADLMVVDSTEKTVRVNGAYVDYQGTFPEFYPGSKVLQYSDTFTDREVDITGEYNKRYI